MIPAPSDATLLRIYLGESDHIDHRPVYEAIVLKAREMKMAGATVLRGPLGFGASAHLHSAKILQLSADLPIVVEIVDEASRIEEFWKVVQPMLDGGLATTEPVRVLAYGPKGSSRND